MQFVIHDGYYKIVRMTGNQDNYLALKIQKSKCETTIKDVSLSNNHIKNLDSQFVLEEVFKGLEEINVELDSNCFISDIQYVASDSQPYSVYSYLTKELINYFQGSIS